MNSMSHYKNNKIFQAKIAGVKETQLEENKLVAFYIFCYLSLCKIGWSIIGVFLCQACAPYFCFTVGSYGILVTIEIREQKHMS